MLPVNGDAPDDLPGRLVDCAAQLLAERGMAGLSLRRLAVAAGTSTMAVYTRFGDKQRLLAAMRREGFRRLGDRLTAAAGAPTADADDALLELGRAYRSAALAAPQLYGLMFGPLPPGFDLSAEDDQAAGATFGSLVDAVHTAVTTGDLHGDPHRIAAHLWVVAHGMISLELSGQLPYPPEDATRAYDQALFLAAQPFLPEPPSA